MIFVQDVVTSVTFRADLRLSASEGKWFTMTQSTEALTPMVEVWEWQQNGACREASPDIFFHPEGERGPSRERRVQRAKAVCGSCPVLTTCREHALRAREPYGVWGGLTEDEREAIYRAEETDRAS